MVSTGMVNTLTAGVIAPLLFHDPRLLASGMALMLACGVACWTLYLRSARRKPREPLRLALEL